MGLGFIKEYLIHKDAELYFHCMKVAQQYAEVNRQIIKDRILEILNRLSLFEIESVHNYIDFEAGIIRKGAISAQDDEYVVIPFNMAYGTIIGKGKGNEDWNYSAPHGAGRDFSRTQAKKQFRVKEFEEKMEGIWSSCISENTLDESPMAYKDPQKIIEYLKDTVEIIDYLKPIYNLKA